MLNLLRNALALLGGIAIGGAVNMALITLSPSVIAPPAGVDVNDAASLAASIHLFEPRHFLMPFLAHAVGTFAGSLASYLISATYKVPIAYVVGVVFLCGGVAASLMIPAPGWFIALDLVAAYLPMAWVGIRIGERMTRGNASAQKPRTA
jgi:hypothetical protein